MPRLGSILLAPAVGIFAVGKHFRFDKTEMTHERLVRRPNEGNWNGIDRSIGLKRVQTGLESIHIAVTAASWPVM